MTTFNRAELLEVLTEVRPALGTGSLVPAFGYFWFDKQDISAYDGGLGIRLDYDTELECGVPGKPLLDLLKTSTLKDVFLDIVEGSLVLQMGKAKVKLTTLPLEQRTWPFTSVLPKKSTKTLTLSEGILAALKRTGLVTPSKRTQVLHHGVVAVVQKSGLEFYATDSRTIMRIQLDEKAAVGFDRVLLPWGFIDSILKFKAGTKLHILPDCLMAQANGALVCSNLRSLSEAMDIVEVTRPHLNGKQALPTPATLAATVQRAKILAGGDEALLNLSLKDSNLRVKGEWATGSINENMSLKEVAAAEVVANFPANLIERGLDGTDSFSISKNSMVLYGNTGDAAVSYVLASKSAA